MAPPAPLWPYKAEGHQAASGDNRGSGQSVPPLLGPRCCHAKGPAAAGCPRPHGGSGGERRGHRDRDSDSSLPSGTPERRAHARARPRRKRKRRLGSVARCRWEGAGGCLTAAVRGGEGRRWAAGGENERSPTRSTVRTPHGLPREGFGPSRAGRSGPPLSRGQIPPALHLAAASRSLVSGTDSGPPRPWRGCGSVCALVHVRSGGLLHVPRPEGCCEGRSGYFERLC